MKDLDDFVMYASEPKKIFEKNANTLKETYIDPPVNKL